MARIARLRIRSIAAAVCAAGAFFGSSCLMAGEDQPDCRRCSDRGYITCAECHGKGTSSRAKVECPRCHGRKVFECDQCDENGKVRCRECKKREIDGEEVYAVPNPEWKKWNRKKNNEWGAVRDTLEEEPPKYVVCPECEGTGEKKCPRCGGDKEMDCNRCQGNGWILGFGKCPECSGDKIVACPDCNELEGAEAMETLQALEALKKTNVLSPEEYYKRRLILIRAEVKRRVDEARAEAKADPAGAEGAGPERPQEPTEEEKLARFMEARKEAARALAVGFGAGAINGILYEDKVRAMGLRDNVIREIEQEAAKENERVKNLVDLKERFRKGTIDLAGYREALGKL